MYSYGDRIQAVRLYLKLGKRIKATIRQLGYPTKNSLKDGIVNTNSVMIYELAMFVPRRGIRPNRSRLPSIIIWAH